MIDMSKKYRTRDGREVRIYAVDGAKDYSVHGAFLNEEKEWLGESWTESGERFVKGSHGPRDLVEVKTEVWVCVFEGGVRNFTAYDTKEDCEKWARSSMTNGKPVRFVQEDE
tara:strand:+ start:223 stop:558 length:336 start_codon:yes stop_codon:yes gene_type:complete